MYAELAVALQDIRHEIHRPGHVFLLRSHERILDSGGQAFAQRLALVEVNRLVDTVDLLVVPRMPINLHARVMLMSCSSAISPAISLRASGVRVFFDHLAENFVVQGEIGVHPLELGVLLFEFLETLQLAYLEAAMLYLNGA